MSKGLKALKELQRHHYGTLEEFDKKLSIIEEELKDFEWLKSTLSVDWFDKLTTDDKLRFLKIMGVKYE